MLTGRDESIANVLWIDDRLHLVNAVFEVEGDTFTVGEDHRVGLSEAHIDSVFFPEGIH